MKSHYVSKNKSKGDRRPLKSIHPPDITYRMLCQTWFLLGWVLGVPKYMLRFGIELPNRQKSQKDQKLVNST